jgi:hypothetical protein
LNFEFSNRPHIFIDSETGEKLKIHPKAIQQEYLQQFEAFKLELKTTCLQYKIELIEAFIGNDFNQILFPFLMKRAKLI